jgi:arylsulfatase
VHCGRWSTGKREEFKYTKCAVRTDQWRFSNNKELYNIVVDPGEKNEVSAANPEVVSELQKSYQAWWKEVVPLMVNEDLPEVKPEDQPFAKRYYKQLEEYGIPEWAPDSID